MSGETREPCPCTCGAHADGAPRDCEWGHENACATCVPPDLHEVIRDQLERRPARPKES